MADVLMNSKDAVSGSLAKCFVTIHEKNGRDSRYNFMQATKIEAKMEKSKTEVAILGKTGKGNKATGWKGTGSATFHYNTSIFRQILEEYKNTGKDLYFDMEVYNTDSASDAGKQVTILYNCNLDGGIIAKFDANSEVLEEDLNFTFDDFKIKTKFTMLPGMAVK